MSDTKLAGRDENKGMDEEAAGEKEEEPDDEDDQLAMEAAIGTRLRGWLAGDAEPAGWEKGFVNGGERREAVGPSSMAAVASERRWHSVRQSRHQRGSYSDRTIVSRVSARRESKRSRSRDTQIERDRESSSSSSSSSSTMRRLVEWRQQSQPRVHNNHFPLSSQL